MSEPGQGRGRSPAPGGRRAGGRWWQRLTRFGYGVGEGVRIALASVRATAVRSGLTILGVAIGVGVVVIMAALITGIRAEVSEGIEAAGPRNLHVARFDVTDVQFVQDGTQRPPWWNRPPLTLREADLLGEVDGVARSVVSVGLQDPSQGPLTFYFEGQEVSNVQAAGETADWPSYRAGEFVEGRNFVNPEVSQARPVVVVSVRLARALFGEQPAVGREVRVGRGGNRLPLPVTVVGAFDPGGGLFTDLAPYLAVFPHTTAVERLGMSDDFLQVIVVPEADRSVAEVEDRVVGTLRGLRGLGPAEPNDFSVIRSEQLLAFFDEVTGMFFIVMLALSSVGLLVGGVGVVGIMMISVTERTREIGLRKAVGATRAEILWQFLVEAAVLTALGGGLGLLGGAAAASGVAHLTPIPAAIPLWSVAVALGVALVTGLFFGLLPAHRAARLEPVAALRNE